MRRRLDLPLSEARDRLARALEGSPGSPVVSAIALSSAPLFGSDNGDSFTVTCAFRPKSPWHVFGRVRLIESGPDTELIVRFRSGAFWGAGLCFAAAVGFLIYGASAPGNQIAATAVFAVPLAGGGAYLLFGGWQDRRTILRGLSELFRGARPAT